jgi:hypothetical protein
MQSGVSSPMSQADKVRAALKKRINRLLSDTSLSIDDLAAEIEAVLEEDPESLLQGDADADDGDGDAPAPLPSRRKESRSAWAGYRGDDARQLAEHRERRRASTAPQGGAALGRWLQS